MKIRIEKLQKELSRGTAAEQYQAIKQLKEFVISNLSKEQAGLQSTVSSIQDLINEINGNLYGNTPEVSQN